MSDSLLPNDGESFDTSSYADLPKERKEEEIAEVGAKAASYPILPKIADWFEQAIKDCNNLDNITLGKPMELNGVLYDGNTSVSAQILAYRLLKEKLIEKYHEFAEFQEDLDG